MRGPQDDPIMRSVVCLFLIAAAAVADPKPASDGAPKPDRAAELVRQLGHSRFAVREAAAKELVELGGAAIPALTAGTRAADAEIRNRAIALLPQAQAVEWNRRVELYLADSDRKHKHDLPLLAEYEKLVGTSDPGSRKLFAAMVTSSGNFLQEASASPSSAKTALRARCQDLAAAPGRDTPQRKLSSGELAALYFVHGRLGKETAEWTGSDHPAHLLSNPGLSDGLTAKDVGPAFRRLLARWGETRPTADITSQQYFSLAVLSHPFPEAVPALGRMASDENASIVNVRVVAITALGKIGNPEAKTVLEKLMTLKTTSVHGFRGEESYQLPDIAFAARVGAERKDPKDYGIQDGMNLGFRGSGQRDVIHVILPRFPDDSARRKGLTKWATESKKK